MKVTIISHHAPALLRVISYNRSRRPTWSCWPGCWTSSATRRSSSGRSSPTCSPGATTPSTSSITPQEGLTSTSSLSVGLSLGDHYRWSWSCCQRPSWCCKPGTHAAPSATFASWSTSGSTRNLTSQCLRYILALIVSIVARLMINQWPSSICTLYIAWQVFQRTVRKHPDRVCLYFEDQASSNSINISSTITRITLSSTMSKWATLLFLTTDVTLLLSKSGLDVQAAWRVQ